MPRKSKKSTDAKNTQAFAMRYDAAGNGRRMRGWTAPSSGPNRAIEGLQKLRDRASDAVRNDWTGAAALQRWVTNLVGVGIVPRIKRITDTKKKQRYSDLWDDWTKVSDADGVLTFYGQESLATRGFVERGEVFARLRYRRPTFGLTVPLQVQLIEADFVPMLDTDSWPGLATGNRIRSGIELDRSGQRVAYWVFKEHPGDNFGGTIDRSKLIRVPVSEMRHIFEPKRPGQLRGVPDFAPILARLRNVADFDDAVLERQKLANLFAAFIKKPPSTNPADIDSITGLPIEQGEEGPLAQLFPGIVQELLPGEEMQFANPPEAGTSYPEYMRQQNLGTAAGQGLPYEIMSGDIANVSDRTLRIVINEFRRYCEQRQWQVIIPMLCEFVRNAWVDQAVLVGEINRADADDCKRVEWAPHGWAYIHPVQDVQAKQIEVDNGFRSRSSVIAERGDDPDIVDAERATDKKRETALDVPVKPPMVDPNKIDPAKQQADKAAAAKATAETGLLNARAEAVRLEAEANAERARAQAQASEAAAEAARNEAEYYGARAAQAQAEATLASARADQSKAEITALAAEAEHVRAQSAQESDARIAALKEAAEIARAEANERIEQMRAAEAHAAELREVTLSIERKREEAARMELEASRLGLDELRGA